MKKVNQARLSGFAEDDLLQRAVEQYRQTGEAMTKSEWRKLKSIGGSRFNELFDRLLSQGLIYRGKKTVDVFAPDPEDEELDERARRESISSEVAAKAFESIKGVLSILPPAVVDGVRLFQELRVLPRLRKTENVREIDETEPEPPSLETPPAIF